MISIFEPHNDVNTPDSIESPRDIIATAKACFETLLRMYYLRHGFESYDYALLQYLPQLAFSSLRDVENVSLGVEQVALQSTQLLSAKGLWDQGRNMLICKAIFSHFRNSLNDPELQQEVAQFTDDLDFALMMRELRSKWPIGVFNVPKGGGDVSITNYLKLSKEL